MRHGSLFSGIGGFDLASEWMGWENVFHCEWNEFGQKVLKYYWPKAITYNDITKTDFSIHRGTIDILTGGFPCQPYSSAGKRLGTEDSRHLWPEMLRTIREIQPTWVVGENVRGLTNWNGGLVFNEVQADLETEGYEVQPYVLPAASVNAPHRRDRVWFVAYSDHKGRSAGSGQVQSKDGEVSEWDNNAESSNSSIQPITSDSNGLNSGEGNRKKVASNRWESSEYKSEGNKVWDKHSTISGTGIFTDSTSLGLCKHGEGQRLFFETSGASIGMGKEYATDSNGIGQECWQEGGCSERGTQPNDQLTKRRNKLPGADFKMFPSVSPICDGDDGISDRLDSITFPKWRQESIKAGGNAIVPQVVYQIFKAIEQYETTRQT